MTPAQIATLGQDLATRNLSRRASRAAWAILGRRAAGWTVRIGDIAEATGWTGHHAARAVRELQDQAPDLLTKGEGYKALLTFTIEEAPEELGPIQAPNIGTDTGPNSELGPIQAPNIGTDTGPNSEIGTDTGPKNSPFLNSKDVVSRGVENTRAQDSTPDSTLPNMTQAEATRSATAITVGDTRDRLATLGFSLPVLTSPSTVQMIQKWRSWGTTPDQLERGIEVAHAQVGGSRPGSPAYYQWAIANVIQADAEAAKEPEQATPPAQATGKGAKGTSKPHKKGTNHDLHGKDYSAGATQPADLPGFLRG